MPFGSPVSGELNGSRYILRVSHVSEPTIAIILEIPGTGDSGGDSTDGDAIFQVIVDLFDSDPDFTIKNAYKTYPTTVDCTPTP